MWKMFLDDIRIATKVSPYYHDCVTVRSYDEAVILMEKDGCPSFIAFDHDLAEDHYAPTNPKYKPPSQSGTGYDLAHWIVSKDLQERGNFIPDDFKYACHSMNPAGKENIMKLLDSYLAFKREENCRKACSL